MKNLFLVLVIISFTVDVVAQNERGVVKTKANVKDNKVSLDGSVDRGGIIHFEVDANSNDIVFIPTSPSPTVLVYDVAKESYVIAPKDIKTGGSNSTSTWIFTPTSDTAGKKGIQEKGLSNKCNADGDIDIDISTLEEGTYQVSKKGIKEKGLSNFDIEIKIFYKDSRKGTRLSIIE